MRCVALVGGLCIFAIMFRRVDAVVLATPFLVGLLLGLARGTTVTPTVSMSAAASSLLEGEVTRLVVTVAASEPIDVVSVKVATHSEWISGYKDVPERCVRLGAGEERELRFRVRTTRWGRRQVGPASAFAAAGYGLLRRGPFVTGMVTVATVPIAEDFQAVDVVPHAAGMVGLHRSRRIGDGTDIAGVRPFQVGDRLHRINWPVSLRRGELHVTATLSDRDAEVALVLDTTYDVGESEGIDGRSSSLDTTVRAAAAVAEHYLRHGDRVGLLDLSRAVRRVPAGGGRAHLIRLLDVLLDVRDTRADGAQIAAGMALGQLGRGSLVLLMTPLIGESVLERAAAMAYAGYAVLVVDTLPADAAPPRRSDWTTLAWRLWLLERDQEIGRLSELGVPVVPWRGPGSLDEVLRDVSMAAGAPRIMR
ncbi:MAG: DUF58 domain-containing protein [Mycobacteriales bacterium]